MKKIGAILFFAIALPAAAQTNLPSRTLSLDDCIASALQHNFDVRVVRYEPQLSLYDLRSAYAGYDPVFNLSGQHSHNRSGGFFTTNGVSFSDQNSYNTDLGGLTPFGTSYDLFGSVAETSGSSPQNSGGQFGVNVTQPLLRNFWVDNTRVTISVAKNRLKFSEQTLRQQIITTVTDVENAFYELIFARENVRVQQQALELAQTQLNQDKQRVEVGSLAPLDVQQDEAQSAQSRASLIAAQFTLSVSENALKNLITDRYSEWHDLELLPAGSMDAVQQTFNVQESWSKGMRQRPDLEEAKLDVEQQGIQLKYLRNQIFPEIDLTGSYGYNGAGVGFRDTFGQAGEASRPFYSYGAQLSVPLSNARARNQFKSGKATEQQILLRLKQLEQSVMVAIDNAVKQAQSALESVEATRQARTYAESALNAEQKKYSVGKSTTFTVLQLQNTLTAQRSQEIRALADYNQALANLALQEGDTLNRHKLDLNVK